MVIHQKYNSTTPNNIIHLYRGYNRCSIPITPQYVHRKFYNLHIHIMSRPTIM